MTDTLLNRLKDPKFIEKLIENNEVSGSENLRFSEPFPNQYIG